MGKISPCEVILRIAILYPLLYLFAGVVSVNHSQSQQLHKVMAAANLSELLDVIQSEICLD